MCRSAYGYWEKQVYCGKMVKKQLKTDLLIIIKKSKNFKKIIYCNETSDIFFEKNKQTFNFIYVDGCHNPDYVKRDINNAFKVLEKKWHYVDR